MARPTAHSFSQPWGLVMGWVQGPSKSQSESSEGQSLDFHLNYWVREVLFSALPLELLSSDNINLELLLTEDLPENEAKAGGKRDKVLITYIEPWIQPCLKLEKTLDYIKYDSVNSLLKYLESLQHGSSKPNFRSYISWFQVLLCLTSCETLGWDDTCRCQNSACHIMNPQCMLTIIMSHFY